MGKRHYAFYWHTSTQSFANFMPSVVPVPLLVTTTSSVAGSTFAFAEGLGSSSVLTSLSLSLSLSSLQTHTLSQIHAMMMSCFDKRDSPVCVHSFLLSLYLHHVVVRCQSIITCHNIERESAESYEKENLPRYMWNPTKCVTMRKAGHPIMPLQKRIPR